MTDHKSIDSIEEYLIQHGTLTYRNVGVSMLPLLKEGRDLFTVEKKTGKRCRKYDVVLFRKKQNIYVLHRIIKVCEDDYVLMGDNTVTREYGITDQDILGVMTSFIHKGRQYYVSDFRYKVYVRIWVGLFPVRLFLKRFLNKMSRLLKTDK